MIELWSARDTLPRLKAKMQEDLDNGALLGWMIDRQNRKVYIYRPNQDPQVLDHPESVSGEPELPGFRLPMAKIWQR